MDKERKMLLKFSAYGFLKNLRFFEPFLYLFFLETGLSFFQIGVLIAIREVFVNLFEIPSGAIADLTGRRRAMVFSFSSYILSFLVFYFFSGFLLFIPAIILFSSGEAFRSGTHKSMIMEYLDIKGMRDRQVRYYGKTRSASRLGSALSALLAALIVFYRGNYNVVFLATLLPYSLDLLLMLTYPKELDGKITSNVISLRELLDQFKSSFGSILSTQEMGKVLVNASIFDSLFKIGKDYLQPIIKTQALALPVLLAVEDGQSRTSILVGIVYFFIYLNSFVSSRKSSDLMERVGSVARSLNRLLWADVLLFFTAGVGVLVDSLLIPAISFLLFYTLYNLRKPMVVGFLGTRIQSKERATVLSVHSQLRSIFGIVIAPTFGLLADHFGIFAVLFFGGSLLLVVGLTLGISGDS
ncbi:MAG: MFS transporter [Candidatus Bipolaricaulota bacterium]|nr:MFS transporter [Candidatus Bipolaricaulota bacterium]MBS3792070.1 MFS transporter [Candidatus Bipolaricaulota bacterium]